MNNQLSIINNHSVVGILLQLKPHQITGFIDGDICPFCKNQNIIFRSGRNDYLCGECFEVFTIVDGKVHSLGNQENLD